MACRLFKIMHCQKQKQFMLNVVEFLNVNSSSPLASMDSKNPLNDSKKKKLTINIKLRMVV